MVLGASLFLVVFAAITLTAAQTSAGKHDEGLLSENDMMVRSLNVMKSLQKDTDLVNGAENRELDPIDTEKAFQELSVQPFGRKLGELTDEDYCKAANFGTTMFMYDTCIKRRRRTRRPRPRFASGMDERLLNNQQTHGDMLSNQGPQDMGKGSQDTGDPSKPHLTIEETCAGLNLFFSFGPLYDKCLKREAMRRKNRERQKQRERQRQES